jgi:ectoine hydroxylase-related dioxygenase (phytanoyl-CoA dioxygenase family)
VVERSGVEMGAAVGHFHEHGFVVLPRFLTDNELRLAQAELGQMFPTAEQYHDGPESDRASRFAVGPFAGIDPFPYASVEWSLLGLSEPIVGLAEALLGTSSIRLYEAHNWAKYSGAAEYDQPLHRDFANHTPVVPTSDARFAEVEMFIYIHDVPEDHGPTHVVSQVHTVDLPMWPPRLTREDHPEIYASEESAAGPAGTVLAYKTDTFHRGTSMTVEKGARFVLKASYRTISDIWFDRPGLSQRLGKDWYRFVERATPRQLELAGFPPRGHRYWTAATWSEVCRRYPSADLSSFRPR